MPSCCRQYASLWLTMPAFLHLEQIATSVLQLLLVQ